jgi:hypothetical protein
MIEVTLDGKTYQEMHVDGGAFAQTFLYPSALTRNRAQRKRTGQPVVEARAFIIRNGRLDPEWAAAERRTLGIAGRAISTMMSRHAGPAPISRRSGLRRRGPVCEARRLTPAQTGRSLLRFGVGSSFLQFRSRAAMVTGRSIYVTFRARKAESTSND